MPFQKINRTVETQNLKYLPVTEQVFHAKPKMHFLGLCK